MESKAFSAGTQLVIRGKTGKDISMLASIRDEAEVLFDDGARFRVVERENDLVKAGGGRYARIVLEEVSEHGG